MDTSGVGIVTFIADTVAFAALGRTVYLACSAWWHSTRDVLVPLRFAKVFEGDASIQTRGRGRRWLILFPAAAATAFVAFNFVRYPQSLSCNLLGLDPTTPTLSAVLDLYYAFGGATSIALISSVSRATTDLIEVDRQQQRNAELHGDDEIDAEDEAEIDLELGEEGRAAAGSSSPESNPMLTTASILQSSLVPFVRVPLLNVTALACGLYLFPVLLFGRSCGSA